MPLYILAGEEEFLLSRRVEELKAKLIDPAFASFNFSKLISPSLAEATTACLSLPFGTGNKVVLVDRCDLFTKKKSASAASEAATDKIVKAQVEEFDQALSMISPQTHVIFACPYNFDASLRNSKVASKHAEIEAFPQEKFRQGGQNGKLETWCRKEAKHFGATIDDQAINYLLESSDANLRQVSKEIEKAATFVLPNTHITDDVVSQLSSHMSHIFALIDRWADKQNAQALASLQELLSRQPGIPIIAALQTTLSRLIDIKAQAQKIESKQPAGRGLDRRELPIGTLAAKVAADLKMQPWLVEMDLKRARKLSLEWLINKRAQLVKLEYYVKTGQIPDTHALSLFISA